MDNAIMFYILHDLMIVKMYLEWISRLSFGICVVGKNMTSLDNLNCCCDVSSLVAPHPPQTF